MEQRSAETVNYEASQIISVLENGNENFIFGNGWMGQKFFAALCAMNIKIAGFVVSKKADSVQFGVPVYTVEEIRKLNGRKNIFVALRDQDKELNSLLQENCEVLYPVTYPRDITLIEARFYLDYLKKHGTDCSGYFVNLQGFEFINPFEKPDDYLLSWVYEAGDLLLPVLYNDFSRIDEGSYEGENTELETGDVVFDCGANIGLFTSVAVQKGCKVFAFEPMPEAIAYLGELKEKWNDAIEICPYALADKKGKAEFLVQNDDLIGASLFEGHNSIDKRYEVKVMAIDDFVREHQIEKVDYIKADIEGSERDMLRGAKETIKKFLPKISICTYHLDDDKEVLENIIREISDSYVIEHKWKKLYAYVPDRKQILS